VWKVASVLVRRTRQALSEAFRFSLAHLETGTVAPTSAPRRIAPHSTAFPRPHGDDSRLARPFRAAGGSAPGTRTPRSARDRALPSWTSDPLQRFRHFGSGIGCSFPTLPPFDCTHAGRPAPPPSVLGVFGGARSREHLRRPRRFSPRRASRAASRRPGTLMRFHLQGLAPPRGSAPLSRPLLSCALDPPATPLSAAHGARLQSLAPPGESVPRRAETPPQPLPS
jgi:hypothetical protein